MFVVEYRHNGSTPWLRDLSVTFESRETAAEFAEPVNAQARVVSLRCKCTSQRTFGGTAYQCIRDSHEDTGHEFHEDFDTAA